MSDAHDPDLFPCAAWLDDACPTCAWVNAQLVLHEAAACLRDEGARTDAVSAIETLVAAGAGDVDPFAALRAREDFAQLARGVAEYDANVGDGWNRGKARESAETRILIAARSIVAAAAAPPAPEPGEL